MLRRRTVILLGLSISLLLAHEFRSFAAEAPPKKVVLIAGEKSHGPVGNGIHDYPWSVKLLKVMLDNSNVSEQLRVEYHLDGWPADPRTLDDADTIMVVSDGRDGDKYEEAPHFQSEERAAVIARQMERGCGFLTFHFSTFAPDKYARQILDWSGGYFDWETDGRREWYSAIQTLDAEVRPATPDHPICRGVQPFRMREEFYFNIRFRPNDAALKPILTVPALPGREPDGRVVAWARERDDGGRGFGTTCGHFYENWKNGDFRRTILNAIVWTAGLHVPAGGVEARYYTHEEITAALDGVEGTERAALDERPIKAVILTGRQHPAHKWEDTTPALKEVLERDPRMRVDVSENIEDLAADKISGYDLLVLNYCNWKQPGLSEAAKQGFVRYVKQGGGLCIIHFANGAFHFSLPDTGDSDWPEYRKICRRVWDHTPGKSGHDPYGRFVVEIAEKDHPITQGMEPFETTDELYFRQQGDEPIEVLATARSQVTGQFEPMAFVYSYGDGRVFQTVLGHSAESIRVPGTADLIRRGAAWVARRKQVPRSLLREARITGHWGEEAVGFRWTEADSEDNRWNRMDVGPFLASIVPLPGYPPVRKGLSIRIGDRQEATACYDTDHCVLRAAWTDGFLEFDPARFGLIRPPRIAGELVFASGEPPEWKTSGAQYKGLFLRNDRVVLHYRMGGTDVRESPWIEMRGDVRAITRTIEVGPTREPLTIPVLERAGKPAIGAIAGVDVATVENGGRMTAVAVSGAEGSLIQAEQNAVFLAIPPADEPRRVKLFVWSGSPEQIGEFAALVRASAPPEDLGFLSQPGAPRWTETITTGGELGTADGPYVVDTLRLPFDNPYRALMFVSGHDFFSSGDLALCTAHGDVWLVSGIDATLRRLTWKRFATGLFQPLGLKIVDDQVYVLGRDQITRLHDRNGDGEADYYECFNNDQFTSPGGHDYVACLETDSVGRFYYVHATQGVVRVSADGRRLDVLATGLRNPNGMSVGPEGTITVAPQEGEWTPASCVVQVRAGGHYGYGGPRPAPERPLGYDPPLCWIPRLRDNSSGGQVWVTSDRWGPLAGHLLHLSYGKCRMMLVLRETIEGQPQGGTLEFPLDFASGVMRGRFSPHDGQLYVSGLRGWVSSAVHDGCLQRVRYTGRPVDLPVAVRTLRNGLAITFTRPLDRETATRPDNYHVQQWNYRYSDAYGSPEYRVSDPRQEGRDDVPVVSATLLDPRTVFLELDDLRPVDQMTIAYTLNTADGAPLEQTIAYTIHRIGPDRIAPDRLVRREVPGRLAAETEARLRPGLIARFEQNGRRDARRSRLAALHVPAVTAPTPFLTDGAFSATFEGWIRLPLRGEYAFRLDGNGKAHLRINGRAVLSGTGDLSQIPPVTTELHQGYNRIELEFAGPPDNDASVRLLWSSDSFPDEPVPPNVLVCDAGDPELAAAEQLRHGRELVGRHRCLNCHRFPSEAAIAGPVLPEWQRPAPSLGDAGKRFSPTWLYHWLLQPSRLRNDATMPRMFAGDGAEARQDAADIAAYLATFGEASHHAGAGQQPGELAESGEALYSDLGCVGCHRLTEPAGEDEHGRGSLHFVGAKYRPGVLEAFLRTPHAHDPWSRMPDFQLSEWEAAALAAFLRMAAQGRLEHSDELSRADPKRGEQLLQQRNCASCHAIGDRHVRGAAPRSEFPREPEAAGCLAIEPGRRGRAPVPALGESDRTALLAFLKTDGESLARRVLPEASARLVKNLRCAACHARDGEPSPRQLLIVEETASGLPPEALPELTWTGEKLNADWTAQLLRGTLAYRSRPWLKARMPAFPAHADLLAAGLAAEHGVDPANEESFRPDPELAALGHRLSLKDTGLDCRQCHGVGREQPLGDANTQLAPGINFSHVRERLRYDFYSRFVLDPPRYEIGTKMPRLSADGRTTPVTETLGGDARRQYDALWHFIQSSPPPPPQQGR